MTAVYPVELERKEKKPLVGETVNEGCIELGVRVAESICFIGKLNPFGCRVYYCQVMYKMTAFSYFWF
jgi:hypothetical protein